MHQDRERCVRAVQSKDARFDGWFYTAVTSTRIYCRPSCPVVPPKVENMVFHPSAASAQRAGFRACKRCRPDASPSSPEWNERADMVARAMRLIADGVIDRDGVGGLASRLGYSVRQVERQVAAELGAGPLALARAQRAQTARLLTETTTMPLGEVAFASGFASVRAFNQTVREVFSSTPSELRARSAGSPAPNSPSSPGSLSLRLPYRGPMAADTLFARLAADAVPGLEQWRDGVYRRTLRLTHGPGIVELSAPVATEGGGHVEGRLRLTDLRDLTTAISRCRRLLDLDADPAAVRERLQRDPVLEPWVRKDPGRRLPGTVDPAELAVRALLGQGVTADVGRDRVARLVAELGEPVDDPDGALTRTFPPVDALAAAAVPAPLAGLVTALAEGFVVLDAGTDRDEARARLAALPGVEPRTVEIVLACGLGDPDAFAATDAGVRATARELGLDDRPEALTERARAWSPWRAYAVAYLLPVPHQGVRESIGDSTEHSTEDGLGESTGKGGAEHG